MAAEEMPEPRPAPHLDSVKRQRDEALDACTDLGKMFAAQTVVLVGARRERDSLARRLALRFQEKQRAIEIIGYALHLRMHGERAPGGDETWEAFDRMAEQFLRAHTAAGEMEEGRSGPEALFGRDAGPEWLHAGACSWPERACTGHVTSYQPVQVPENTGKHPGESGETGSNADFCPFCQRTTGKPHASWCVPGRSARAPR